MSLPSVISLNKEIHYDFNSVEFDCPVSTPQGITNVGPLITTGNVSITGNVSATGSVASNTNSTTTSSTVGTNLLVNGTITTNSISFNGLPTVSGTFSIAATLVTNIVFTGNAVINFSRFGKTLWINLVQPVTSVVGNNPITASYDLSSQSPTGIFSSTQVPATYAPTVVNVVAQTLYMTTVSPPSSLFRLNGQVSANQAAGTLFCQAIFILV